jgi:hypothetical protein
MKNICIIVALAAFSAACDLPKQVSPDKLSGSTARKVDRPATTTVGPKAPGLSEISEAQQVSNKNIILAVTKAAVDHKNSNKKLPEWVAKQYASFEGEDYTKEHAAFQRSFGWGTGTLNGKPFHWFAYTNTDAWLQFNFSVQLDEKLRDVAVMQKDGYGHTWEIGLKSIPERPGTATWMGVTNFWTDQHCTQPKCDYCDIGSVLDETVAEMNKALGLDLVVRGKFPWEHWERLQEMAK